MAKVKIILDKDETQHEAEQALTKALNHHSSGDVHSSHAFQDPAMADVAKKMEDTFKKINQEMLQEISDVLDQDYLKPNGH
jgi:hypothetical protein